MKKKRITRNEKNGRNEVIKRRKKNPSYFRAQNSWEKKNRRNKMKKKEMKKKKIIKIMTNKSEREIKRGYKKSDDFKVTS